MVCYQVSAGNDAAKRAARGKHYVCFNLASDKGSELKAAHPLLKWVADLDGHPTLPFSVACRLILPLYAEVDQRDAGLLVAFPTEQLFERLWAALVPHAAIKGVHEIKNTETHAIKDKFVRTLGVDPEQVQHETCCAQWID